MFSRISYGFACIALFLSATVFTAFPANAIESTRLFTYKHWAVDAVAFDDGTLACQASVEGDDLSFSIWTYADRSVELQFYLGFEDFGSSEYFKDILLEVDRRGEWDLSDAKFYQNSIFFLLPPSDWDAAMDLLEEIAAGNKLSLMNRFGEEQAWFSLAGSRATIRELSECQSLISDYDAW